VSSHAEREAVETVDALRARVRELEAAYADEVVRAEEAVREVDALRAAGDKLADALYTISNAPVTGAPDWPIEAWREAVQKKEAALAGWREARRG
jgi:ethanolamine utilization cobalamin adenosyltransferase